MDANSDKLRVLIIAEAANPEWVSVPLVGWSHAEALSRLVDTHVVTQIRNRDAIERFGWTHGVEFTALDTESLARPVFRAADFARTKLHLGWTVVTAAQALSYFQFELKVWREFGKRIESGEFDIVHRITPLSPTAPSLIAKRCDRAGVPFVVGPLNGSVPWPKEFRAEQHREGEFLSYVRDAYKLLPGYRDTRASASAIIAGSRAVLEEMPTEYRDKCVYSPENAIDPDRFGKEAVASTEGPLRVCFIGRLVPYKGADMLIEASAPLLRAGQMTLDIIGDGPERPKLQSMVTERGLEGHVELAGWVEHTHLQDRLVQSEVFAFPSVREFGGGVVLEVMALGVVPVVLDYAGPSELVTSTTGFKVPMGTRDEVIAGFRAQLSRLCDSKAPLDEMRARGKKRVRDHYTWDAKAAQTHEVYRWVLGQADRPTRDIPLPDRP
ncbi:MAG: glycosyltransferase family 4 protein [Myxococcota bacterium]